MYLLSKKNSLNTNLANKINTINSKLETKSISTSIIGLDIVCNDIMVDIVYSAAQTIASKTWLNNMFEIPKKPKHTVTFIVWSSHNGDHVGFGKIDTQGLVSIYNSTTSSISNVAFSTTYLI